MADEFIALLCSEGGTVVDRHIRAPPVSLKAIAGFPSASTLGRDDDDPVGGT